MFNVIDSIKLPNYSRENLLKPFLIDSEISLDSLAHESACNNDCEDSNIESERAGQADVLS